MRPIDESTLLSIERQRPDPRSLASLSRAFESSISKREKQWIALTLTHLDEQADQYIAFLTGFAQDAIEDQTPYFAAYDASGRQIRGQFSPVFENWCAQNSKDPRTMATLQTYDEPEDVLMLARANAPQSRDLLRKGLNSSNPLIVAYSAQGLARIHDMTSIVIVAAAAARFPQAESLTIGMQLPWYGTSEANILMERLVPEPAARAFYARQVRDRQSLEIEITASRQAGPAPR